MEKTPISALASLCFRRNLTAKYILVSTEGKVHAPTFSYEIQVADVSATAQGPSKKKAKHAAALLAYAKLAETEEELEDLKQLKLFSKILVTPLTEGKENLSPNDNNPVGKLQELCMRKKWTPPYYDSREINSLPHERVFGVSCLVSFLEYETFGQGKSKKVAKRIAAQEMLKELAKNNYYNANEPDYSGRDFSDSFSITKEKIDKIFQNLDPTFLSYFNENRHLYYSSSDANYTEILENMALMGHFKLKTLKLFFGDQYFLFLSLRAKDGLKHEMNTLTSWGESNNIEEAKSKASRNMLHVLDSMIFKH